MFEEATALVVEDSYATSQLISQILHHELKFGKVLCASNGKQGLTYFETNMVDWIFCDIEMPKMDGFELLAAVRGSSRGKKLPFVLMSSHRDKETIAKAMASGATDFVAKPFNAAAIIEKVRRIGLNAAAGEKAPRQRRRVARLKLDKGLPCKVQFSAEVGYMAELVNLSLTGCLLRSPPFNQGGTIFDPVRLSFSANGTPLQLTATLRRMEAEHKKPDEGEERKMTVLSGCQFIGLNSSMISSLKALITQLAATSEG
jgi:CheY-like chemotaxis protein